MVLHPSLLWYYGFTNKYYQPYRLVSHLVHNILFGADKEGGYQPHILKDEGGNAAIGDDVESF